MPAAELAKTIRRTLAYFDVLDYPLTAAEIQLFLFQPGQNFNLLQVLNELEILVNDRALSTERGFYFLPGRAALVDERLDRYAQSMIKIKKARWLLKIIVRLPFVRGLYIVNNGAYFHARAQSDLDLAIICAPNKIWTVRLLANLILILSGRRTQPQKKSQALCLSFFAAQNALAFSGAAYETDIHFIYWLKQWLPIAVPAELRQKFIANNSWVDEFLPQAPWPMVSPQLAIKIENAAPRFSLRGAGEFILKLKFFERLFKKFQLAILPQSLKTLSVEKPKDVIISDSLLKFHSNDRRLAIRDQWLGKTGKMFITR